jgi:hypothetical protein
MCSSPIITRSAAPPRQCQRNQRISRERNIRLIVSPHGRIQWTVAGGNAFARSKMLPVTIKAYRFLAGVIITTTGPIDPLYFRET